MAGFFDGLAGRALLVTLTRIANQGLIILSPVLLVHLLTVEEFGRYREFLLYAGVLISIGAFGIYNSLLYFVPLRPLHRLQYVRQAMVLTLMNSTLIVAATLVLNAIFDGALVGEYAWPLAAYVLLFVNMDFWEYLWLAEKRTAAVFGYTSGRLVVRMTVVVTAAWLTGEVQGILVALVTLEAVRFIGAWIGWRQLLRRQRAVEGTGGAGDSWSEQIRFCLPIGASSLLVVGNKSLGGMFVAKLLGPVALAQYAIGTYVQPIVTVLRNSISDVLLPEMVGRGTQGEVDRLALWRRATIVFAMLLIPTGIVLARYAEIIVTTLFSTNYLPAVILFQVYLVVLLRECFDFGVPLRALGRTAAIVHSNLIALALNLGLLWILMPRMGLLGAVVAFAVSRFVEGIYLGWRVQRLYGLSFGELAAWGDLLKVIAASVVASVVLWNPWWTQSMGLGGAILAGLVFATIFALMLKLLKLPEATLLWQRLWHLVGPRSDMASRPSAPR